jgi:hypothetical protein
MVGVLSATHWISSTLIPLRSCCNQNAGYVVFGNMKLPIEKMLNLCIKVLVRLVWSLVQTEEN